MTDTADHWVYLLFVFRPACIEKLTVETRSSRKETHPDGDWHAKVETHRLVNPKMMRAGFLVAPISDKPIFIASKNFPSLLHTRIGMCKQATSNLFGGLQPQNNHHWIMSWTVLVGLPDFHDAFFDFQWGSKQKNTESTKVLFSFGLSAECLLSMAQNC